MARARRTKDLFGQFCRHLGRITNGAAIWAFVREEFRLLSHRVINKQQFFSIVNGKENGLWPSRRLRRLIYLYRHGSIDLSWCVIIYLYSHGRINL
jgi:hypothetical protein